jgi:hypothetical protein
VNCERAGNALAVEPIASGDAGIAASIMGPENVEQQVAATDRSISMSLLRNSRS